MFSVYSITRSVVGMVMKYELICVQRIIKWFMFLFKRKSIPSKRVHISNGLKSSHDQYIPAKDIIIEA